MTNDNSAHGAEDDSSGATAAAHRAGTAVQDGSASDVGDRQNGVTSHGDGAVRDDQAGRKNGARRDRGPARPADTETTANLPAVGGRDDPYLDRNTRASKGSSAAASVGPPRPTAAAPPASFPPLPGSPGAANPPGAANLSGAANPSASGDSASATRPASGSAAAVAAAPAPPAPRTLPSAVDQYAALGVASDTPTSAVAAITAASLAGTAAPVASASDAPKLARAVRRPRGERTPRRARLQIRHFNVWTVFKFSVVLAVALFFVWMIIVAVLYGTLDHLQVIEKINKTVRTIENDSGTTDAVTPRIIFTTAFLIGLVNIVLFIVLSTIGSVVYNLCADLVGGIEITLAERD